MWEKIKGFVGLFPATLMAGGGAALIGGLLGAQLGGPIVGIFSALLMGAAGAVAGFYKEHYLAATTLGDALKPKATSYGIASLKEPAAAIAADEEKQTFLFTPDDHMLQSTQGFLKQRLIAIKNNPAVSTTQKITAALTLAPIATAIPKVGKEIHARLTGTVQKDGDSRKLLVEQVNLETSHPLVAKMMEGQQHDLTDRGITIPLIKTDNGYQIPLDHPDSLVALNQIVDAVERRNMVNSGVGGDAARQFTETRQVIMPIATAHLLESSAKQYGIAGAKRILDHHYDEYLAKKSTDKEGDTKRVEKYKAVILDKYKDGSLTGKPLDKISDAIYEALSKAEEPVNLTEPAKPIVTDDGSVVIIQSDAAFLKSYSSYDLAPIHQSLANGIKQHQAGVAASESKQQQMDKAVAIFESEKDKPLDSSQAVLPPPPKKVEAARGNQ